VLIHLYASAGPLLGRRYTFDGHGAFLLERSKTLHAQLGDKEKYVSHIQYLVECNAPCCRVLDLGNPSGTYVNGKRVATADLHHRDEIKAGHTYIRVEIPGTLEMARPFMEPPEANPAEVSGAGTRPFGPAPAIPGYRLERELGRGAFGPLYQAVRESDGSALAVKIIVPAIRPMREQAEKILHDAAELRQLDHPQILRLHDLGYAHGKFWFARDMSSGTDVAQMVKDHGRMEEKVAVRVAIKMLAALEHAHSHGFGHGDLRPTNVFLEDQPDKKRTVKVADFALTHVYAASSLSGLTLTSGAVSIDYLAPERIANLQELTAAADQFSAAAILYRLLTDRPLYDVTPPIPTLTNVLEGAVIPLRNRRPQLDPELAHVVERALAREPVDRYEDVKAFAAALLPFAA
jgi:eukaryotic-like serine/threonine-protein kinase